VIAARGKLVAGREFHPWPRLARRLFRGPSLDEAWQQTGAVRTLKLDLKQSDAAFLDQVVAFLSPRLGSRTVIVSTADRGALLVLRDRLPGAQLVYSAGRPAAVERLRADPALAASLSAISAFQGLVDADLLRWAHARHLKVFAWTVDGGPRLAQLVRLGVDGVTTANLAVLRALGGP
jgi:glycerophosphoryl diester phosphodiesterase